MSKQMMSIEDIKSFWTDQAKQHGLSHAASWSDKGVIDLEIREIVKWLEEGNSVLDVGCANGYSTIQFAIQRRLAINGLDYIPEMIEQARKRYELLREAIQGDVKFEVGDITQIDKPDNSYDRVVVIRVVINLGQWSQQAKAIKECARVLKPGGLLLLSEATLQGWTKLNAFRREWGLEEIPMPAFNSYVDQTRVIEVASPELELVHVFDFASTYYVGTRILKPLLIKALNINLEVANPEMEWNRWFAQLPPAGEYGVQKLFVFKKV